MKIDLNKFSTQAWLSLLGSSFGLLVSLGWVSMSMGFAKPARFIPMGGALIFSAGAAVAASRGLKPARKWQVDDISDVVCFEAERENALEEIQEEDDNRRELDRYERKLTIEATAMQRTLPLQLQLQQMKAMLYPVPVMQPMAVIPPQMGMAGQIPQAPPFVAGQMPDNQFRYFDWKELADADEHPVLMIVAKQGSGKTWLIRFLASHALSGATVTAIDIFAKRGDWEGCKVYDDYESILGWMGSAIRTIDDRVTQYKDGETDFTPLLWAFEEYPDTTKSIKASDKNNGKTITQFMDKCSTIARKTKCRLCLISQKLNADGAGVDAEVRDDATVIFPGRSGIGKAMADSRVFKLGAARNEALRQQLTAALANVPRPALVYAAGQWYPAIIPEMDSSGNPLGTAPPETDAQRLDRLFNQDDSPD